jgi:UDP-glucose 4-epimerase
VRAIVTGGAGFIGSHVVDALVAAQHDVVALDDLSNGRRENLAASGAPLVETDVRDADAVAAAFDRFRPELVFHLAARTQVKRSIETPAYDARINVEGTINVLEASRRVGARRVVNTSTGGAIYGDSTTLPTPESALPQPKAPYGMSKLAAEGYCDLYRRLHGLSTVTLRYGNVYGPRQDPFGEAGIVAILCGAAARGRPVTIFGDGRQTRDYTFVEDVAAANLAAARADASGSLNVGRGAQTSVLDLVHELGAIAGRPLEVVHAAARPGEVRHSSLDPARAAVELGWRAELDVRAGLARTFAFVVDAVGAPS